MTDHSTIISQYKLTQISHSSDINPDGLIDVKRITYFNAKGEPIKTIAEAPRTGNSHQAYIYNKTGDLKQLIYYFGDAPSPLNQSPEDGNSNFVVHLYTNNKKGEIAIDSFHYTGGRPILESQLQSVTNFYYDAQSRLIRKEIRNIPFSQPMEVTTHTYKANGNLSDNLYDNKLNFKRLSKIMMFLTEDYSVNNKITNGIDPNYTYSYYTNGLVSKANGNSIIPFEDTGLASSLITYNK